MTNYYANEITDLIDLFFDKTMQNPFNTKGINRESNVEKTENEIKVQIAVPGYQKEDLKIKVDSGWLYLSASVNEDNKDFWRKDFEKKAYVGKDIDTRAISAKLESGIMTIVLPKKEELKAIGIEIS